MEILQYTPDMQAQGTQFYNRIDRQRPALPSRKRGRICYGNTWSYDR